MCCNRAACFLFLNCFFISLTTSAQDSGQSPDRNQGNVPRASAAKYHSHAQKDGFSLGAELLSRKEASSVFAANVNGCCLVVQVSVYPKKVEPTELSLLDFSLVEFKTGKPVRPESPANVATRLAKKKNPKGGADVTVSRGVDYESGTDIDPRTGQPVHARGVSTSTRVGVSPGSSTPVGIADHNSEIIERELCEKGLSEARVSIPVAGYLYFPLTKPKKDAKYQLVYSGQSEPLTLWLP